MQDFIEQQQDLGTTRGLSINNQNIFRARLDAWPTIRLTSLTLEGGSLKWVEGIEGPKTSQKRPLGSAIPKISINRKPQKGFQCPKSQNLQIRNHPILTCFSLLALLCQPVPLMRVISTHSREKTTKCATKNTDKLQITYNTNEENRLQCLKP